MEIEFGNVKDYKENGFGFLSRTFKDPRNRVWFHITKIKLKYPELAKKLDSGSYLDIKLWYEVGKVNDKKQATQIWLDPQDIPKDKRDVLVEYIEEVWSNTSRKSIPEWLDQITIDLVGQSRRDELSNNRNLRLKTLEIASEHPFRVNSLAGDCDLSTKTPLERIRELLKSRSQSSTRVRVGMGRSRNMEVSRVQNLNRDTDEKCSVEELRKNETGRIAKSYGLTKMEADELYQLLEEMRPLNFTRSKQLSKYIVEHQLGHKYQHISGVLRMREAGEEWDFHGGFPPRIYAIICEELKLGNQGTPARPVRFTPFKDIY